MTDVVVFGLGSFAETVRAYLDDDSPHSVVAFTAHERYIDRDELMGLPVVRFETLTQTHPPDRYAMFVGVGYTGVNRGRRDVYGQCLELGYELVSYVSSKAMCAADFVLGGNCFIFEGNLIQPHVRMGNNVIMWSGSHIAHDSTIEDHVFIAPRAAIAGEVTIGEESFVGINATVRDGIAVAPRCVIGAGAVIMKDTIEGGVYSVRGTEPVDKKSWELTSL